MRGGAYGATALSFGAMILQDRMLWDVFGPSRPLGIESLDIDTWMHVDGACGAQMVGPYEMSHRGLHAARR